MKRIVCGTDALRGAEIHMVDTTGLVAYKDGVRYETEVEMDWGYCYCYDYEGTSNRCTCTPTPTVIAYRIEE